MCETHTEKERERERVREDYAEIWKGASSDCHIRSHTFLRCESVACSGVSLRVCVCARLTHDSSAAGGWGAAADTTLNWKTF